MIDDMLCNKKLNPIVTELFVRGRNLNIFLVFIAGSYFAVPKNIRLSSTHYFIMKNPNKWNFQQIAFNRSSDIDFKYFMNLDIKRSQLSLTVSWRQSNHMETYQSVHSANHLTGSNMT